MSSELLEAFHAFSGGLEMDGRSFVKCLKDSGLIDECFQTVDADIIFAKWKPKGGRKIDFSTFTQSLRSVARRKHMTHEQVIDAVCLIAGPDYEHGMGQTYPEGSGPERFFYDRSTYTGTHKHGGPTTLGCGETAGDIVTDQSLVNRDRQHEVAASALRRTRALSARLSGSSRSYPRLLGSRTQSERLKASDQDRDDIARVLAAEDRIEDTTQDVSGPARFYYDRSTYTGTHRHGGQSSNGSGILRDNGYNDLSELVRRDHIQDDALQRRRRHALVSKSTATSSGSLRVLDEPSRALPTLLGARGPDSPSAKASQDQWQCEKAPVTQVQRHSLAGAPIFAQPPVYNVPDANPALKVPAPPVMGTRYVHVVNNPLPAQSVTAPYVYPTQPSLPVAVSGQPMRMASVQVQAQLYQIPSNFAPQCTVLASPVQQVATGWQYISR